MKVPKIKCSWDCHGNNFDEAVYQTGCNSAHEFMEGDITDNDYKFCPFCGGEIYITVELGDLEPE